MHLNKSYGHGNLFPQQRKQRGLILHADGIEHLVLSVDVDLPGTSAGDSVPLGWVIPVPAPPIAYSVDLPADVLELARTLHQEHSTVASYRRHRSFSYSHSGGTRNSYGAHRYSSVQRPKLAITRQKVGDYDVTLLQPLSDGVLGELNEWFRNNGFREVAASHVEYFLRNGFSFVCAKVGRSPDTAGGSDNLELKPLCISFPTAQLFYPLKFSSNQGMFDLELYTLTARAVDFQSSESACSQLRISSRMYHADNQWDRYGHRSIYRRNTLIASSLPGEWVSGRPELQRGSWYLNRIDSQQLNASPSEKIQDWDDDIFFALAKEPRLAHETDVTYLKWLKNSLQVQQYTSGHGHYPRFKYFRPRTVLTP